MNQQHYKSNVKATSGDVTTTGFSIDVNESMFQLLTSNVYNDTVLAVMREWSTNACDACLQAGKEVIYDVHIPTPEEPTFFVRDYGTGLSPDDIVGLFSQLGASTKRNSSQLNGTLG
jgi:HSP90 family molecular chaperone